MNVFYVLISLMLQCINSYSFAANHLVEQLLCTHCNYFIGAAGEHPYKTHRYYDNYIYKGCSFKFSPDVQYHSENQYIVSFE